MDALQTKTPVNQTAMPNAVTPAPLLPVPAAVEPDSLEPPIVQPANDPMVKIFISFLAILILFIYRYYEIKLEWYDVVILVLALLPWFSYFIDNLKIGKESVELTFLKQLNQKVTQLDSKVENEVVPKVEAAKQIGETAFEAAVGGVGGQTTSTAALTADTKTERTISGEKEEDTTAENPADPQKGKWGGSPTNNGRRLSAEVERVPNENRYRRITLRVVSTDETKPLTGKVTFHLHPTFRNKKLDVPVINGVAEKTIIAWGAFTVGAEADGGKTTLELDLADLSDGIDPFFDR